MEHKQADGTGNQQLTRTGLEPLFGAFLLQGITGATAGQDKEQRHKPGVQDVHHNILVLGHLGIRAEASDAAKDAFIIIEVDYVIKEHQEHRDPAQIVHPMLSHLVRPPIAWSMMA